MVLKPGKEEMAAAIFEKWELDFAVIGEVTDTQHMVLEFNGEVVCDIPLGPLAADAPEYDRPYLSKEEYKAWAQVKPLGEVPESADIGADLLKLMANPALASRTDMSPPAENARPEPVSTIARASSSCLAAANRRPNSWCRVSSTAFISERGLSIVATRT